MSKTIRYTVASGNMGDGWADQNRAADEFAEFLADQLQQEFPDAEVRVTVARNTSGNTGGVNVDGGDEWDEYRAGHVLDQAWEKFCSVIF